MSDTTQNMPGEPSVCMNLSEYYKFRRAIQERDDLLHTLTLIATEKNMCRISAQRLAREAIDKLRIEVSK